GARDPGRSAAELPGIAFPGIAARLVGAWNRIGPPEMLSGCGLPAVDEAARAVFGPGDAGDNDSIGDQRRHRHRIAFLDVGRLLTPELLARLHVEGDHIGIERGAEELAFVDRATPVDDAAAHNARRLGGILDLALPDLLAGL